MRRCRAWLLIKQPVVLAHEVEQACPGASPKGWGETYRTTGDLTGERKGSLTGGKVLTVRERDVGKEKHCMQDGGWRDIRETYRTLPRKELQDSKSMQMHRMPTLTWITANLRCLELRETLSMYPFLCFLVPTHHVFLKPGRNPASCRQ